jgi:aromatic ring-opening dioxygenase catalytic subunit (LigB family)
MIVFNVKFYVIDRDDDSIVESYYLNTTGDNYELKKDTYDVLYNASGDEGYKQAIFSNLFQAMKVAEMTRDRVSKLLDGNRYHTYYIEKITI